jgi:outer membrane lipoprotein SlyB
MNKFRSVASATIIVTVVLAGCASPAHRQPVVYQPYPSAPQAYPAPQTYPATPSYPAQSQSNYYSYGVVDSIQLRHPANATGAGIGLGAVAGGVVGGVLGNQVGGGRGKKLATVAGVVGGAMVGHEIEQRNAQTQNVYQIGVRLNSGAYQTFTQESVADLRVGSRVRIENDRVYRY